MSLQAGRGFDHKIIPSWSRANMKWLNVVLGLNGILCICQGERPMLMGTMYVVSELPHSSNVLHLVGTKAIYVQPLC
jgi:hypothetical protein